MATKSFNDICVEYAHQLGKGLPLTAPEMCNAVIMYLNAQITEMQGITTALQTAVTEAEASATEAINKADNVSEKVDTMNQAISDFEDEIGDPKYIAKLNVNNVFTQNNSFNRSADANIFTVKNRLNLDPGAVYINNSNNFVRFQSKNGTLALTSDIPDIPEPTTSDNGKVIGVENGEYALVERSGGEAPANMVTTDTKQVITGIKNFLLSADNHACGIIISKTGSDIYNCYYPGYMRVYNGSSGSTSLHFSPEPNGVYTLNIPNVNGILAVRNDIPDLDNYTGTVHIVQGTAGSGIAIHDTSPSSPYTKYGYNKIETYGNSNALKYTLNIPNKNGTIATLDDISSAPSPAKYFTRVIYHSTDDDTQYVIFSCMTDTDLSANTSYQNVVDLLNNLGATTQNTALPCTGKTGSGDIVVGVYTDGSNIIVFNTDSTTEELNMSAEIKFISK